MNTKPPVLISWVAVNNDPFERDREGKPAPGNGEHIPGPTLTLLFDAESPYKGKITDVVFFYRHQAGPDGERERRALEELKPEIASRGPKLKFHLEAWQADDPTDHQAIFRFLREKMPDIRRRFADRPLVIHTSPGTPSMQTIWVLMAETGMIEAPFEVVKSYRRQERRGRPPVVPLDVGLDTFYKAYRASRPRQVGSEEQGVLWDPKKFRSEKMLRLFKEARRFASLSVPVLILGERGTGKTTLAGWIRQSSPFRKEAQDDRWPAVACGQYNPETMRAELFGYVKDAFTGASKNKDGLLKAADGDTLFLDEVGDVSRDLQRLLIKALEEKQYFRLGEDRPQKSDFRLLTATNLDPVELRTRLDPDFLDRISLLTLRLPALREIPEELDWLWQSTYEEAARRSGTLKSASRLGADHHEKVVATLKRYPLPGNLRELFRVAYRLLAAKADPLEPLSPADATDYALAGLENSGEETSTDLSKAVARSYVESAPLDPVVDTFNSLPWQDVEEGFKEYFGREILRIARTRKLKVDDLCGKSERSLRDWVNHERKNSAE